MDLEMLNVILCKSNILTVLPNYLYKVFSTELIIETNKIFYR